jgi:hypothetical protein
MKMKSNLSPTLATAVVTCLLLTHDIAAAATLVDVGILGTGTGNSHAYGLSDSGRATGRSFATSSSVPLCFRTQPMTPLNSSSDPAANVQSYLQYSFGSMYSTGYGIEQSGTGPVEIAGELMLYNTVATWRAFWYYENGSTRNARLLSLPSSGTSNNAVAIKQLSSGGTAVVGHSWVNGQPQACYWAVSSSGDWLYNYGAAYFSGFNSWATDTDGNRTIGYYEHGPNPFPFIIDGTTGPKHMLPVGGGGDGAPPFGMYTSGTTSYIVGYTFEASTRRPVLWTYVDSSNVTQQQLDRYGYDHGIARSINDAGQIVGSVWNTPYPNSGYDERACFWRLPSLGGGGGLLNDQGSFNLTLIRAYKVASSSTSSRVAGFGIDNTSGYARGFILDHAD